MGRFVLMGVSGCGKTTVGTALAERCGVQFVDGDALHPDENIRKMSSGQPLNDEDRAPWLIEVGRTLGAMSGSGMIGCSALKKQYRDLIRAQVGEPVHFIHLYAPKEVLAARVAAREGHFMPASLLDSQYHTLEMPDDDELGTLIDIDQPVEAVIAQSERYVRETIA